MSAYTKDRKAFCEKYKNIEGRVKCDCGGSFLLKTRYGHFDTFKHQRHEELLKNGNK